MKKGTKKETKKEVVKENSLQWDGTYEGYKTICGQFKDLKSQCDYKTVITRNLQEVKVTSWIIKTNLGYIPVRKNDWIIKEGNVYLIGKGK